jgi:hypothetical protein
MTDVHYSDHAVAQPSVGRLDAGSSTIETVMSVLKDVRPLQANGLPYGYDCNLADAGFTSVEMVNVMLGVESAFDVMIPQDLITPENFQSAAAIAAMIGKL